MPGIIKESSIHFSINSFEYSSPPKGSFESGAGKFITDSHNTPLMFYSFDAFATSSSK